MKTVDQDTLRRIKAYNNEKVVDKFLELYELPKHEAKILFDEVKKWIWLCAKRDYDAVSGRVSQPPKLIMLSSLWLFDEMWHQFILFTRDYAVFCDRFFGAFVHHEPSVDLPTADAAKTAVEEYKADLRVFFSYVDAHLGQETLELWFGVFPKKFHQAFVEGARRRPNFSGGGPSDKKKNPLFGANA